MSKMSNKTAPLITASRRPSPIFVKKRVVTSLPVNVTPPNKYTVTGTDNTVDKGPNKKRPNRTVFNQEDIKPKRTRPTAAADTRMAVPIYAIAIGVVVKPRIKTPSAGF